MNKIVKSKDYDYFGFRDIISQLCREYKFLSTFICARSCGGREIFGIRLGKADEYSFFTAAFHGSERITANVLLMFIEELCYSIKYNKEIAGMNIEKAFFGRGAMFVPLVNPDGCEIALKGVQGCGAIGDIITKLCDGDFKHWNANLRGVDINHNFNAGWKRLREIEKSQGIYGPGPTRFGGYMPESEPETVALTEICHTNKIRHAIALHSQGEVIYSKYGDFNPRRSEKMAEILATASGYALEQPSEIADGGGFKDWFISRFNRPGFTFELGKGENPLPIESAEEIYLKIREALTLSAIM